jgi:hypothetical protein
VTPRPEYTRHRSDASQAAIVADLRKIPGVSVEIIGRPCDLLIGYNVRGRHGGPRNFLIEWKEPGGRLTQEQQDFEREWQGQFAICRSLKEVLEVLGIGTDPWKDNEGHSRTLRFGKGTT